MRVSAELAAWVINLRRWFHRFPEPGLEEHRTQERIVEVLDSLGIENRRAAGTGVIATIRGRQPGPTVALRADMDALRIDEVETELNREYRSENDGLMHACGHDGHMAMALGAARLLKEHEADFQGQVRIIFQPAEETLPGGAVGIINDGGLRGVQGIFGLHLLGGTGPGELRFRPGAFMAHPCDYEVTITGRSGHHLRPEQCIDPIVIAARFVSSIQQDIKANVDPLEAYVFGFGMVKGGTQYNQTPETVSIRGSYRAFNQTVSDTIEQVMRRNLDGLIASFASPEVSERPGYGLQVTPGYPVLVNSEGFACRASSALSAAGFEVTDDEKPNLGGEDFARYLEQVPGLFVFLGAGNPDRGIVHFNHSNRFDIDEAVLAVGVRALLTLALDFLGHPDEYVRGQAGRERGAEGSRNRVWGTGNGE